MVAREKVREFASAVFATAPIHHEVDAATAAGYPDLVAPPTFPIVIQEKTLHQLLSHPGAGIDFSRVVHGDQKFEYHRPLVAGDEVEEPIGASQRLPTTAVRPRAQGWKASFLAFLASVQTSQSIRQARSDPNFCSPHGRASRRSVVMVGVGGGGRHVAGVMSRVCCRDFTL